MTMRPTRGKLIVLEGPDGVGKSTFARLLTIRLCEAGIQCEHLSFPGNRSGTLGRFVNDLHHKTSGVRLAEVNPTSLQLLHIAAHIDTIEAHILPALRVGKWVIHERYWWSTWVYGLAFGVSETSLEAMIQLEQLHWGLVKPVILVLLERDNENESDRAELHSRIVEGYRKLASEQKQHLKIVVLRNESTVANALDELCDLVFPI